MRLPLIIGAEGGAEPGRAADARCGSKQVIPWLRTRRCLGRRTRPGRRVRAGGLCEVVAAISIAPAGGRHVPGSDTQSASIAPAGGLHVTGSEPQSHMRHGESTPSALAETTA